MNFFFNGLRPNLLVAALISVLLVACNDDNDDPTPDATKPTIALSQPALQGTSLPAGSSLAIVAQLTDDVELSEVRIEIHDAFDGHSHSDKTNATAFAWDTIIAISGTRTYNLSLQVPIPADAATGPYHLILNALDQSGNLADFVEADLVLTSPSMPMLDSLRLDGAVPMDENHVHFMPGETVLQRNLTAWLSDADGLQTAEFVLKEADHHGKAQHGDEPVWDLDVALGGTQTYNLNVNVPFERAKLENDHHYVLFIRVTDVLGNNNIQELEFHVML